MINKSNYITHYNDHYKKNGLAGSGVGLGEKPSLLKMAGYKDGMSLLDYGCGWGALAGWLPKTTEYVGVDLIKEAIDLAKKQNPDRNFLVIENGELKITPKDFAVAFSVFTHALVESVSDCLSDIYNNTKDNAIIFLDILEGDPRNSSLHIRYWDKNDFCKVLNSHNMIVRNSFVRKWDNGYTHTYFVLEKI